MILSGEDIARAPTHVSAERLQCFDQHRSLNRHVQRTHDTHTLERLLSGVFFAGRHQPGHLELCDLDFFATEVSKGDVFDLIVSFCKCVCAHIF